MEQAGEAHGIRNLRWGEININPKKQSYYLFFYSPQDLESPLNVTATPPDSTESSVEGISVRPRKLRYSKKGDFLML